MYYKTHIPVTGDTATEARDHLMEFSVEDLATAAVNQRLNKLIDDTEGSPIPYFGWFWRDIDFFSPKGITIAEGNGRIAICENNKWGYPERYLTGGEQAQFRDLVWAAYLEYSKGGTILETRMNIREALETAGEFIARLSGSFEDRF